MRRIVVASATIFIAIVSFASAAAAVGPGGWDHVGIGSTSTTPSLNGAVYALNTQKPGVLYVGGVFTSGGGNTHAKRIAAWNGSTWSALGTTALNGSVRAIAYDAATNRVFAGGEFTNAGGNADADFLAVWDGSSWAPFCNPATPSTPSFTAAVMALQIIGNTLYVGGAFGNGAGLPAADFLVACDLTTGAASPTVAHDGDINSGVSALTADSNGILYAGGSFINLAGDPAADHVAAYDPVGATWHAMGSGTPNGGAVNDLVRSLTAHGTTVYVGTDALDVAGIAQADHIARWDGSAWSAVGSNSAGTNGWLPASAFIYAMTTYQSLVIAAGSFQNANGVATGDEIAYFDGTTWQPIGSNGAGNGPLNAAPNALAVTGGKLYAGGVFTSAGGDSMAQFLAAHALRQPDASIGATSTGTFAGNNVYSATGAGEVRSVAVTRGRSTTSYVKIQNDGIVSAGFTVKGTGGATGIAVHYYRGTTNITSAVRAATYATGNIDARGSILIRMVVTVATSSAASATFTTTGISTAGTPRDAIRMVVHATG